MADDWSPLGPLAGEWAGDVGVDCSTGRSTLHRVD